MTGMALRSRCALAAVGRNSRFTAFAHPPTAASLIQAAGNRFQHTFDAKQNTSQSQSATLAPSSASSSTTHFGFDTVTEDRKETLVGQVFHSVASNYDLMNDLMSAGIHRLWKAHLVNTLAPGPDTRMIDVAGGTGDIAFRLLDHVAAAANVTSPQTNKQTDTGILGCIASNIDGLGLLGVRESNPSALGSANVTVVDINPAMLNVGRKRAAKLGYPADSPHINFIEGNAEHLEAIPDASMDAYTIAFGIRNCTHIDRVLAEAYRVLKPGGRFLCLEFARVQNPVVSGIYDVYSFQVIPRLGDLIANDRKSYQYLVESIRKFPTQPVFARMIQDAGFRVVGQGWEDLTLGVAAIHSGYKI